MATLTVLLQDRQHLLVERHRLGCGWNHPSTENSNQQSSDPSPSTHIGLLRVNGPCERTSGRLRQTVSAVPGTRNVHPSTSLCSVQDCSCVPANSAED